MKYAGFFRTLDEQRSDLWYSIITGEIPPLESK